MTQRLVLTGDGVPRLAPHMRLRHDAVRDIWTVQAPERSFMLDEIAHAVIARCDGHTSLSIIIEGLCGDFPDAPRDVIAADVTDLLQGLANKGVIIA
jgi:pyrroloquinoline quinone biosynthesis protein D